MTEQVDLAVIGAGPAGYVGAIRGAQLGLKTLCVDKRKALGGTCLNVGCIPSKALLQSSEHFAFLQHHGQEHGISGEEAKADLPTMMKRKDKVVKSLTDGIAGLFKKNQVLSMEGNARLVGPNAIEVNGQTIEAKNILIATGSAPIELPFMPFDEEKIVSSTGALSLKEVPERLLVVGGGVIGVELASVFNRLGSKVVVVEMLDHICAGMDAALSKALLQTLKKQGMKFHLEYAVKECKETPEGVQLLLSKGESNMVAVGDVVLVAIGRRPYTEGLGLENVGISLTKRKTIQVDKNFHTGVGGIYAVGDVIDGPMLAHKASEEAVAAVEHIAGLHSHVHYLAIPNVIYTHPEVASVGLTEKEARDAGFNLIIGTCHFRGNARARCAGDDEGLVKVVGDKESGRLLGLHIIGPNASELIGAGMTALIQRATVEALAYAPSAHPTLSEAIKEAALDALGKAIHL